MVEAERARSGMELLMGQITLKLTRIDDLRS
jgi:hypothetical protein